MKILIAPLNWGLGHASRCVPLVRRLMDDGHEVILGGDGESLTLLRRHFPKLRYVYLAPLNLRYSAGRRQVWAIVKALPKIIHWALQDHAMLAAVLREEPIDQVISDNRFGLYNRHTKCVYMTHQLHIMLPNGWRWLEPLVARMHARIYTRYNKVWVPDYKEPANSLAGELSHPSNVQCPMSNIQYIDPLSRFVTPSFQRESKEGFYDVVVVLSGLEPQRTLLEKEILARYQDTDDKVLIVQGLLNRPNTRIKRANMTIVPYMNDEELVPALLGAKHIIARSGYSTIMDFAALGILKKAELIPTSGQPEQEYLATWIEQKALF